MHNSGDVPLSSVYLQYSTMALLAINSLVVLVVCLISAGSSSIIGVLSFTSDVPHQYLHHHSTYVASAPISIATTRRTPTSISRSKLFFGDDDNNNNDNKEDYTDDNYSTKNWIMTRLEQADLVEVRRDLMLTTCFVLGRYFVYDITTGIKIVPGFDIQDLLWLSGTLSSATLLGIYWTVAGLLTRLFETKSSSTNLIANAVNIAMCCPIWIASEHYFHFGPKDVGGATLDISIANGFIGLSVFIAAIKTITSDWR